MPEQKLSPIMLAFGLRDLLASKATAYVTATLERLLPLLLMPDRSVLDLIEEARQSEFLDTVCDTCESEDDAEQYANDLLQGFFDEQRFLQRQVREFAFPTLFHMLERTVQKVLRDHDRLHRGAVLQDNKKPLNFNDMLSILARCGYETRTLPFRQNLDKLNLIANAVKHGHGPALKTLSEKFPELFLNRVPDEELASEHLLLTTELLNEIAASVSAFWTAFPMQQYS